MTALKSLRLGGVVRIIELINPRDWVQQFVTSLLMNDIYSRMKISAVPIAPSDRHDVLRKMV